MPCVECRKAMDPEERAVEVNRHLLARLSSGPGFLALPVPTVSPVPARQQRKASSGLLSKKEAARRLGMDRATTLAQFIASGRLKTVDVNGHQRIPGPRRNTNSTTAPASFMGIPVVMATP